MPAERVNGGDRGYSGPRAISSITVATGDIMAYDRANEVLVLATSSTTPEALAGVATEAKTTADTEMQVQEIQDDDEYIFDLTNNSSANHNFQRMLLTDESEVNNTGTDDTTDAAIVVQIHPVGAASDKKMRGRFVTRQDRAA